MKKIIMLCLMCAALSFPLVSHAEDIMLTYDGDTHKYTGSLFGLTVNGRAVNTPLEPIIFNDRAVVPVREVFEALGAAVDYKDDTREIFIELSGTSVRLQINSSEVTINGTVKKIEDGVVPKLIAKNGGSAKTMVPVRLAAEALGAEVDFHEGVIQLYTAEYVSASLTKISYSLQSDRLTTLIRLDFDGEIGTLGELTASGSGVIYTDISNVANKAANTTEVNTDAVKSVRIGQHESFMRVAVDLSDYSKYQYKVSKDKKTVYIAVTANKKDDSDKSEGGIYDGKTVVIDAGHGGKDPGANSLDYTVKEKDLTLSIAKKVRDLLAAQGVTVIMTREGDTYPTLTDRSDLANNSNAALFLSVHINSATITTANGYEVYYSKLNNGSDYGIESSQVAENVITAISKEISAKNRGVKDADHVVTKTSNMPAVLVEVGFISNAEELAKMCSEEYQSAVAQGIANGITKSLSVLTMPSAEELFDLSEIE